MKNRNSLNCPLCNRGHTEPLMCPHCSTVFCKGCINEYLKNNYSFCPHCDFHIMELADCKRLIMEVK